MSGIRKYPHSLKLAMQDTHQKDDKFYGTEKNLNTSRKRSAAKTKRHHAVKKMLERLGMK